ncbi:unnamed protein product [Musa hybrid cultivar]
MFTKKLMDLCKKTSCPVSAGDFVLSHQQTFTIIYPTRFRYTYTEANRTWEAADLHHL